MIHKELKIIEGAPSPTRTPLYPHSLPSTTICTGWAAQTLKHQDAGQVVRGGNVLAGSQLGRHTGGRRVPTVTDDGRKTKHQADKEGRTYEKRESMRGQGRGRVCLEYQRGVKGRPGQLLQKRKVTT